MKRLHLHITVPEIEKAVSFYNILFNQSPAVEKADYAKWLLDDPAINFAISTRGKTTGLNHLGFQVDDDESLAEITDRLKRAEFSGYAESEANCCYAKSNKYWTRDPANIPWENFHTLGQIPVFGDDTQPSAETIPSADSSGEKSDGRCCN
jgi:catechol 2,3-dioxygenase-like lactoylglutathione lyase family enzyme